MEAPRDMGEKKKKYLSRIAQKFWETPSYFCAILEETFSPAFIMLPSVPMKLSRVLQLFVTVRSCYYLLLVLLLTVQHQQLQQLTCQFI